MAKASLTLPNGTKVNINGTADEVAALLSKISQPAVPSGSRKKTRRRNASTSTSSGATRKARKGPVVLIRELVGEGFFKSKKRSLPDVQKKLEEKGHIYAQTSLSPAVLHLVRKTKVLRRIKDKKGWVYVN